MNPAATLPTPVEHVSVEGTDEQLGSAPSGALRAERLVPTQVQTIQRSWVRVRVGLTLISDVCALSLATAAAVSFRLTGGRVAGTVAIATGASTVTYSDVSAIFLVMWVVAIVLAGGYQRRRLTTLWAQVAAVGRAAVGLLAAVGISSLFLRLQLSRSYVGVGLVSAVGFTLVGRALLASLFVALQRVGIGVDRVVLVGPRASALSSVRSQLETTSARRTRIVDAVYVGAGPQGPDAMERVMQSLRRHGATSAVICDAGALPVGFVRALTVQLSGSDISVVVAPGTSEAVGPGVQLHAVGDLFLLRIRDSQPTTVQRFLKAVFDRAAALVALLVLVPVFVAIAVLIRRESPGPVLFRQRRVGRNGVPFTIYKFRSMTEDAEARLRKDGLWDAYVANGFKLPEGEDPRVTKLGALLRRTSLDELPQLLNVVNGTMSLVGPRPVVPSELPSYGDLAMVYKGVKPGVTGYWQVNGRSDVGFPERAELDAYYFDNRSFRVDLRILSRTIVAVAMRVGAH